MKIWRGFGTEHSMNLVMIGHFRDVDSARVVEDLIDRLTSAVKVEEDSGRLVVGEPIDRFSDEILEFLIDVGVHNIRPEELEQFLYDVNVKSENASVVITTDETDVQALLKVLLDKHARVEVYSAHDHPNTEHGRGE